MFTFNKGKHPMFAFTNARSKMFTSLKAVEIFSSHDWPLILVTLALYESCDVMGQVIAFSGVKAYCKMPHIEKLPDGPGTYRPMRVGLYVATSLETLQSTRYW